MTTNKETGNMDEKALVTTNYQLTQIDPQDIGALLREATGGQGLTPLKDLEQIRMPPGGGLLWNVKTLQGEESLKELQGIIVHHHPARSYWQQTIDQSGTPGPPDCQSLDALTGYGNPGGSCQRCPYAQFGSDAKGRGQACKLSHWIYLLFPDSYMPYLLTISATGVEEAKRFRIKLAAAGKRLSSCIISIGLERTKSRDGAVYSKPTWRFVDDATPELATMAAGLGGSIRANISTPDTTSQKRYESSNGAGPKVEILDDLDDIPEVSVPQAE